MLKETPNIDILPPSTDITPVMIRRDGQRPSSTKPSPGTGSSSSTTGRSRVISPEELVEGAGLLFDQFLQQKLASSRSDGDIIQIPENKIVFQSQNAKPISSNDALSENSDDEYSVGRKKKNLMTRVRERLIRTFSFKRPKYSSNINRHKQTTVNNSIRVMSDPQVEHSEINSDKKIKHFFKSLKSPSHLVHKKTRSDETVHKADVVLTKDEKKLLNKQNYHSLEGHATFRVHPEDTRIPHTSPKKPSELQGLKANQPENFDCVDCGGTAQSSSEFDLNLSSAVDTNLTSDSTDFSPRTPSKPKSFHDLPKEKQDLIYEKLIKKMIKIGDEIQNKHFSKPVKSRCKSTSNFKDSKQDKTRRRTSLPIDNIFMRPRADSYDRAINNIMRSSSYASFQNAINPLVNRQTDFMDQVAVLFNLTGNAIDAQPSLLSRIKSNCMRFFQDNLSGMIATQGGWESVVEDTSSGEVD